MIKRALKVRITICKLILHELPCCLDIKMAKNFISRVTFKKSIATAWKDMSRRFLTLYLDLTRTSALVNEQCVLQARNGEEEAQVTPFVISYNGIWAEVKRYPAP